MYKFENCLDLRPTDITESINIDVCDEIFNQDNCKVNAYNLKVDAKDQSGNPILYNRKTNPDKAVDLMFDFEAGNKKLNIEIWLDTNTRKWNSGSNIIGVKLSPDQMINFFQTKLFSDIKSVLKKIWPDTDDFYHKLYESVERAELDMTTPDICTNEDGEFRKGNIDKEKSKEKNAAGELIRTNSGRKIVSFSDFGVNKAAAAYYCWPAPGKEFKWSLWANYKKINPLARMRFKHNKYNYGMSISPISGDLDNRGWRGYNLDLEPHLLWITTTEMSEVIKLSIVLKFLKFSIHRIKAYLEIPDEEIFKKVNNPEKCPIEAIKKTKSMIRRTLLCLEQADTFVYQ